MVWTFQNKVVVHSFVYSLVACGPFCVCCYCCNCCCKCWKCCGLTMVSIQFSYTSPSKCKCSSPFGNLMSCSFLTSCLCSINYLSCGDVICGTSYLYSLRCFSYGVVIYGIFVVCFGAYTIVGTLNGFTLPLSFFVPLHLCSHVPSSLLNLKLLLPQLCSSS